MPTDEPAPIPAHPTRAQQALQNVALLWTYDDLVAYLPWKESSIRVLVRMKHFPPARALAGPSGHKLVWLPDDVYAWVRQQPTGRPGEALTSADPDDGDEASATSVTDASTSGPRREGAAGRGSIASSASSPPAAVPDGWTVGASPFAARPQTGATS